MKKKTVVLLLALVLVIGCAVGGTVAWLVDSTEAVVNTFSSSNIDITLTETDTVNNAKTFKMVPGATITKDPVVTVETGSEACWLFVKVVEANGAANYIEYAVDTNNWTAVPGETTVYYREVTAEQIAAGASYNVILNNTVTVSEDITKDDMDAIDGVNADAAAAEAELAARPSLTITAYAVQHEGINSVATAWAEAKALDSNP